MPNIHNDRNAIESAVISSILQGGDHVKALCREFDIQPSDFEDSTRRRIFSWLLYEGLSEDWNAMDYVDYLPTAANARYYIELLHESKE